MSSIGTHALLAAVAIAGLGFAAYLLDVPWPWVVAGVAVSLAALARLIVRRSRPPSASA